MLPISSGTSQAVLLVIAEPSFRGFSHAVVPADAQVPRSVVLIPEAPADPPVPVLLLFTDHAVKGIVHFVQTCQSKDY